MQLNDLWSIQLIRDLVFTSGILIGAYVVSMILRHIINFVFNEIADHTSLPKRAAKTKTLKYLFRNIVDVIIFAITLLTILSQWGVDILPLLTGLGIVGLGFSLGAQTLVKDLIAGFFIILENQYNVGDRIKTEKYEGEVLKITLRLTVLKDSKGNIIFIPNSLVTSVTLLNPEAQDIKQAKAQ